MIKVDSSEELEDCNGEAQTNRNLIRICKTLPQSQKEGTLIHEIFHFLNTSLDDGIGHALLDSLSEQFYQVLKDNRMLR